MKLFSLVLLVCSYIFCQITTDARVTGLSKSYWPLSINGDYQGDLFHQKLESRRQAGWGKRRDVAVDEDDSELPPYHPYASLRHMARNWFDDE